MDIWITINCSRCCWWLKQRCSSPIVSRKKILESMLHHNLLHQFSAPFTHRWNATFYRRTSFPTAPANSFTFLVKLWFNFNLEIFDRHMRPRQKCLYGCWMLLLLYIQQWEIVCHAKEDFALPFFLSHHPPAKQPFIVLQGFFCLELFPPPSCCFSFFLIFSRNESIFNKFMA